MEQFSFKPGDVVTAVIDPPRGADPKHATGRFLIRGVVRFNPDYPDHLWLGQELIVHNGEVPGWVTVLSAAVAADVAALEQAAAVAA